MALQTKSAVFAFKEETTEGSLIQPASGSEFTVLREGFSFTSAVETVDSDELVNDIGASKSFFSKETPSGSIPKYFKHSGTEGQAPDYGLFIKSAMGSETVNATEYDTIGGSTAGSSTVAATLVVDSGEGANYAEGQAVLIKDGTNGYAIRHVKSIAGDTLTLNYNLASAPASGVNLGKAVHYAPAASGHPTFSAHLYQASTASGYHQAMAGCRTTSLSVEFPANELASISCDFEGIQYFLNPVTIAATSKYIDFTDDAGTYAAILTEKDYRTPLDLAREIETKMNAVASDTVTCTYSNSTGKFTVASDGSTTFSLLWDTGTNAANTAGSKMGFDTAADDTAAFSYESDNAQDYDPAYTPAFDDAEPNIVRHNELLLGDFTRFDCRQGSNVSFSISTPKTDVNDFCAESGVSESVILEREVTFSATLLLKKHEVEDFDNFIRNTTTSVAFNHGPKDNGNWVAGKCVSVYCPNLSLTANTIADSDGFSVVEVEGTGFVSASDKDVHINLL